MTEKNYITKAKNQFKSSAYYIFWGTATFAVVIGQVYVGTGYRAMSSSIEELIEAYTGRPRIAPTDLYSMPIIR